MPLLLVAQLSLTPAVLDVRPTAPPLPPAEAAATLPRASPDLDLSRGLYPLDALPMINVSPSPDKRRAPGELVPLVAVPPWEPKPLVREIPGITYRLPWGWWKSPATESREAPRRHRSR